MRVRDDVAVRRRAAAQLLFGNQRFSWAQDIPSDRFQALVRELLVTSGKVSWIRSTGHTNERDDGRDLIADWIGPTADRVVPKGASPTSVIPTIIQCKVRSRAVSKSDVLDVRDTIERHGAGGYFLAVSSHLSERLVAYFEAIARRSNTFVEWWNRDEIEDELRRNPDIASRSTEIVTPVS
jgi:hypothetical protein